MTGRAAGATFAVVRRLGIRDIGRFTALGLSLCLAACGPKLAPEAFARPASHEDAPRRPRGVYHTLQRGQTLSALSRVYGVPVATLMHANRVTDPTDIPAGTKILVPGATRVLPIPSQPLLSWPLRGPITSPFGPRGRHSRHTGIDIDGVTGQAIKAAADGRVVEADRHGAYGLEVVIDHGGGLATRYAHASRLLVKRGEMVRRGQKIAEVGRTGDARGSHLHFEVLKNGRPVNPLLSLPR